MEKQTPSRDIGAVGPEKSRRWKSCGDTDKRYKSSTRPTVGNPDGDQIKIARASPIGNPLTPQAVWALCPLSSRQPDLRREFPFGKGWKGEGKALLRLSAVSLSCERIPPPISAGL